MIDELDCFLNTWFKKHDFECTAQLSTDFGFNSEKNIIYYSFIVVDSHNELFLKVCQEICPEIINCDNFILSFFHELGHYATEDDFTEAQWSSYMKLQEVLNNKECADKDYLKYYHHPVEYEATRWACNYIVDNADEVEKLYKQVQKYELAYLTELGYDMQDCET